MVSIPSGLRSALAKTYLALPFKRQVFSAMRRVWVPPDSIRSRLHFRGVFPVDVDGTRILIHNDRLGLETEIFWRGLLGGWEKESLRLWIALCRRSKTILDIGANTGIYALIAKAINSPARVYAFEPIERVWRRLVENNRLNAFDIKCLCEAVSNYDGEGTLYDLPADHVYSVMLDVDMHDGTMQSVATQVPVTRLDTFLARENIEPDLIKIDVESQEPAVLEGMGPYLDRLRPTMLIEIWHDQEHGDLRIGSRVEEQVAGRGYLYYRIDEERGAVREPHIGVPGKGYSNYLICSEEVARSIGLT